jgi:hypothetical protein
MLICFMAIANILWRFGTFYDHLVHFSGFGIMYQEKSGNLVENAQCLNFCSNYIRSTFDIKRPLFLCFSCETFSLFQLFFYIEKRSHWEIHFKENVNRLLLVITFDTSF